MHSNSSQSEIEWVDDPPVTPSLSKKNRTLPLPSVRILIAVRRLCVPCSRGFSDQLPRLAGETSREMLPVTPRKGKKVPPAVPFSPAQLKGIKTKGSRDDPISYDLIDSDVGDAPGSSQV